MSSLDDLFTDPQLAASGFFKRATHPSEGEILYTDLPVRFGGASSTSERLQPRLGEHSFEVLREAGLKRKRNSSAGRIRRNDRRRRERRGGGVMLHPAPR